MTNARAHAPGPSQERRGEKGDATDGSDEHGDGADLGCVNPVSPVTFEPTVPSDARVIEERAR
jgi:hypothetical protein